MSKIELNLNSISSMKKVEYDKLFQKTITWKKAKGVIILLDFKLAGKKTTVAIPYKKPAEMMKAFKELKKDKIHPLKKVAAGLFSLSKTENGTVEGEIDLKKGGMSPAKIMEKAEMPFMSIGIILKVVGAAEAVQDTETEDEAEESTSSSSLSTVDSAKQVTKSIADFKNDYFVRYKSGELEERDSILLEEIKLVFEGFQETMAGEEAALQSKYAPVLEALEKILPQIDKMLLALDGSDPSAQFELSLNAFFTAAKKIEKDTKKIKKVVLKNLKKQRVQDHDLDVVEDTLERINLLEDSYSNLGVTDNDKVEKSYNRIKTQINPQLTQLHEKLVVLAPAKAAEIAANAELDMRLEEIEALIKEEEKKLEEAEKELETLEPPVIPGGLDLLNLLS